MCIGSKVACAALNLTVAIPIVLGIHVIRNHNSMGYGVLIIATNPTRRNPFSVGNLQISLALIYSFTAIQEEYARILTHTIGPL